MANTSSLDDRVRKYTEGVIPARIAEDFTTKKPVMVSKVTERMTELTTIEDRVKGVLSSEAALTCDYVKYHNFAREIYKLQRRFGGGVGMVDEVALVLAKWQARGCTNAILTKIRNNIFAVSAPTPPGP